MDVPPTVDVKGTVTLDSSPLTDADVIFFDGTQYTAFGKTDGTGRFTLKTRFSSEVMESGAPAREYRVTVSKMIPPNGMSEEDYQAQKLALRAKRESGEKILNSDYLPSKIESIPAKYSVASQTTLKANVKANQENDFPFPLTSK
ncbi:carboxypeptidase regulatory-like domain-containing protein [Symmachiella macrocystis]|nr:carboxypeptidase regulatory-like domain-containing protein [Symmachiella macrocystis]